MKQPYKFAIGTVWLIAVSGALGYWYLSTAESREPSLLAWNENCASCHGAALEGTSAGPTLVDAELKNGDQVLQLIASITSGTTGTTKHAWGDTLSPQQIKGLALFVNERRQGYPTTSASYEFRPTDDRVVETMHHDFRLERVATLASRPYSLAPLPNGEILISEKIGGLSIVSAEGKQIRPVSGTPQIREMAIGFGGGWFTLGSLLDVQLHPQFDQNGWIYLSHADRCDWMCGWVVPGTMVRVVRGRITNGEWVDEQVIWSVDTDHYTPVPDAVAAGRLAFDGRGYLYISVGGKNTYDKLHDLNTPYGKVHRVHDDGRIPSDNPFWMVEQDRPGTSTIHTVWSYGHRTGQGLDGHPVNGDIWNSEMGPRGGDEINLISAGQNYGWPLYTNGLDYDGEEVSIGKDLGLNYPIEETALPIVDFTPAPAVSNFTFHRGERFANWDNDILLGTLKEGALYRLRIEDGKLTEQEKLVTRFGRIRDIEMGFDGHVYVVIEHGDDGSLWRLVPVQRAEREG